MANPCLLLLLVVVLLLLLMVCAIEYQYLAFL